MKQSMMTATFVLVCSGAGILHGDAYIFPYLWLYPGMVITNHVSWNIWEIENSVTEHHLFGTVCSRITRTISQEGTNLPAGISCELVRVYDTNEETSEETRTGHAEVYNLKGTVERRAADVCHDSEVKFVETTIVEQREYDKQEKTWSDFRETARYRRIVHFKLRVDDYKNTFYYPPINPHVCQLGINQPATNAWLHPQCDWYMHTDYYGDYDDEPYQRPHEMPADVDCFEVLPESHKGYAFTLRIESLTNAPVKVVCRAYQQTLTMQGMVIQTNIPATLGTVEIEVSSPCQRGHVPYKVQAFRKNPVIIVHGLMDGPRTWDDHDHLWHDLCAMLRYSGHPCEYLYYSTYWTTLELATRKLHDLIDSLYELDTSSVVVIAHSTGALIADLCLARYTASSFRNRVKTLVAIGGVHRGSLFANIWRDLTASSVVGYMIECSAEIKNALEVGSAPMAFLYDRVAFPRTISLAGYWGSATHRYYRGYQEYSPFSEMPRHYPYRFMDPTYLHASDGMVPYFSACASDIGDKQYLVHSYDKEKGMCHSNTHKGNPWIDPLYRENSMLVGNANRHGMYHAITNILGDGELRNMLYTEPVPQQIGALCLLVDAAPLPHCRYEEFAGRNEHEWQAWEQDVDAGVGTGISGVAASEQPYRMFFAPEGLYDVFARYVAAYQTYSPLTSCPSPPVLVERTSSRVRVVIIGGRLDANNTPKMLYWEPYEKNHD